MNSMVQEKAEKQIQSWLEGPFDDETKKRIEALKQTDPETLVDAFQTTLEFGTGGMRGIMDVGTNRINKYTVAFVTQAISNYLHTLTLPKKVAICYDTRMHSFAFAQEVAKVFLGNEIEVHLFKDPRPIALISLAVRELLCAFGVMITASHNPPQYNGYKVYSPEGSQLLPPHDEKIVEETKKILHLDQVKFGSLDNAKFHWIASSFDAIYLRKIHPLVFHPANDQTHGKELKIVYTPLHGAGREIVPKALDFFGFTNYELVQEQMSCDGTFPTIKAPNPEERAALTLGIEQLKKLQGDLLFATDADSDRLAVVVHHKQELIPLSGNETGIIISEYICRSYFEAKQFPPKAILIKTIVTTKLVEKIAAFYGALCLDVLTGFKYIGQKISQFEEEKKANLPSHHFLFGFEESYGYLLGTHVRDKDAVVATIILAEIALQLKHEQKTLVDFLFEIYQKYGLIREKLLSLTFDDGLQTMKAIMTNLRKHLPEQICDAAVLVVEDYQKGEKIFFNSGNREPLFSPRSNVLRFFLQGGTTMVIRPSGTEPKIKLYASLEDSHHIKDLNQMKARLEHLDQKADAFLHAFVQLLKKHK